ncbi:MAG: 3-phosphoshikimate 1-carboxyvinyltransferase [Nitrospirae bacterium]|nr:MAG: 3-phosphoshikimate 1-carboxyvinyltransferase [Nitrospirota bacterium]
MTALVTTPARKPLRGTVTVPGDKSITHRALILGALAEGITQISGYSRGTDCLHTLEAIRACGIVIEEKNHQCVEIQGKGLQGWTEPCGVIDCGNSGTGIRLLSGVLAGQNFFSVLTGDASLRSRPMGRVVAPLREMGATIFGRKGGAFAPLAIQGAQLRGRAHVSPVASAQVKSAILLAGLLAQGTTRVTEPAKSRDHTERMMKFFGITLDIMDCTVALVGQQSFTGTAITVPGDLSAAAFFLVAASIVPESELSLPGVGINPHRIGIVEILQEMGAKIELHRVREESGEPVADLVVRSAPLHGVRIGGQQIPKTIDELPILCVAAAAAEGETEISGAEELRVKETDRIRAMVSELKKMGASIEEKPDGLRIQGGNPLQGARCDSYGDHRVAMSLAVAGLVAQAPVMITDVECIETSFPEFSDKLLELLTISQ